MVRLLDKMKYAIYLILTLVCNRLPIHKNKIFFLSYYGGNYGCNPKYISDYILQNCNPKQFQLVWAFNAPTNKKTMPAIKKVKVMSLSYFYHLCTSKVVISNFRTTELFLKRRDQYYIQTWHSSLRLKQIENDALESLPQSYVKMARNDSKKCDLLLSGCKFSTEIFRRAFWYDGEILEIGTPRNDLFFREDDEKKNEIRNQLNISSNKKIVLYAPTFRKVQSLTPYNLDYQSVIKKLSIKFGGDWIVLVKLHPHLIAESNQLVFGNNVKDVTAYDDIQELLLISDILISDYSSLMFDYSITGRPCFLYVPDLNEYVNNDRELYFNMKELPFISALSNEDLLQKIDEFQHEHYEKRMEQFSKTVGSFENGTACKSLAERIKEICFTKNIQMEDRGDKNEYEAV